MTFDEFLEQKLTEDSEGLLDILVEIALEEGESYSAEETEKEFIAAAQDAFEVVNMLNKYVEQLKALGYDVESAELVSEDGEPELTISTEKKILH